MSVQEITALTLFSYAPTYEQAADRLNRVNQLDQRLAKQFALEMARHNWLRDSVAEELQANDFQLHSIQLDGSEASGRRSHLVDVGGVDEEEDESAGEGVGIFDHDVLA